MFSLMSRLGRSAAIALSSLALVYGVSRLPLPSRVDAATVTAAAFPAPAVDLPIASQTTSQEQHAVFAGGCFWGMEAVFEHVKGVSDVVSGYSGGTAETASYEQTSSGETGHAEAIKITYDPSQVTYGDLLKVYFSVAHDPTQLNQQTPDRGTQYRSAIFFTDDRQQEVAQAYVEQLNAVQVFSRAIVTQIVPLAAFYSAEDYHQNFIDRNPSYPYVVMYDLPKIAQLREQFPDLYR